MEFSDAKFQVAEQAKGYPPQWNGWRVIINDVLTAPVFKTKAAAEVYVDAVRSGKVAPDFDRPPRLQAPP